MQLAETYANDTQEQFFMLHGLAEHVWADRGRLRAHYLRLPDVGRLIEGSRWTEDVLR